MDKYTINRKKFRKFLSSKRTVYPEIYDKITKQHIKDAIIYMQGYVDAIIKEIMPPINKGEFDELIHTQGLYYILRQL